MLNLPNFFSDSFAHLPSSLDKLTEELKTESSASFAALTDFVRSSWGGDPEKLNMLLRKGVFPYNWLNHISKLDATTLPPKSSFYNDLSESSCTDKDYKHATKVWRDFEMKSFKEYTDLYVKTDVLLLVDIFNRYRRECMSSYGLDSIHYFTCPGLTFDAGLKYCNVKLELLTNPDQYIFCERAIRGGVSTICHRFSEANNKYLPESYDPTKPDRYLLYLDANNLYGYCMNQPLPEKNFKWKVNLTMKDIISYDMKSDWGCFVEVDAEIPEELHDYLSDMPPMPESIEITHDMASAVTNKQRSRRFGEDYKATTQRKLAPNLLMKSGYVCHIGVLRKWIELGVKVTRIGNVLEFKQRPWLAEYIKFNTEKRMSADSEFKRSFYKLMINSWFGKSCENVRSRRNIVLISNPKQQKWQVSKPNFKSFTIFDDDIVGVELDIVKVKLDKPIFAGVSILDFAKLHMASFWYDIIKKRYGPRVKLCFTDTDSLLFDVQTYDVYRDMLSMKEHLDTSKYPIDHPLYDPVNHSVPGKFKVGAVLHNLLTKNLTNVC